MNKLTQENNQLIAEFMGFTQEKNIGWYDNDMLMSQNVYDSQDGNCFDELLFHTSWNWLMPVVEKIESINVSNDPYYSDSTFQVTNFVQNWTASFLDRDNVEVVQEEGTTRFEAAYKAVVEFIKWYNEQNK